MVVAEEGIEKQPALSAVNCNQLQQKAEEHSKDNLDAQRNHDNSFCQDEVNGATQAMIHPVTTALLKRLERDFEQAGKRTVRDCLRSKILPCAPVQSLIQSLLSGSGSSENGSESLTQTTNFITAHDLHDSHVAILNSYLHSIKDDALHHENSTNNTHGKTSLMKPSIWFISRFATVTRFLQFLFELLKVGVNQDPNFLPFDRAQVQKWILEELKALLDVTQSLMVRADTKIHIENASWADCYDSETTQHWNAFQVGAFVFGSVTRLDHYARSSPPMISPLWKGLCDLVTAVKSSSSDPICHSWLPAGLLCPALYALHSYLEEGLRPLLEAIQAAVFHNEIPSQPQFQLQLRIFSFLTGRVLTLLEHLPLIDPQDDWQSAVIRNMFDVLVTLRGLEPFLQTQMGIDLPYPEHLVPLTEKARRGLESLLWTQVGKERQNKCSSNAGRSLQISTVESSLFRSGESASAPSLCNVSLAFGQILVYHDILENGLTKEFAKDHLLMSVRVCRQLLFFSWPLCFSAFLGEASRSLHDVILRTTRLVSQTLWCCERSDYFCRNEDTCRAQFYSVLVKWLCPVFPQCEKSDTAMLSRAIQNPWTQEVTVTIIALHASAIGESIPPSDESLVTLLIKVLFDLRTRAELRANVASVLFRLWGTDNIGLKFQMEKLLREEYQALRQKYCQAKRKRKRRPSKLVSLQLMTIVTGFLQEIQLPMRSPSEFIARLSPRISYQALMDAVVVIEKSHPFSPRELEPLVQSCVKAWTRIEKSSRGRHRRFVAFVAIVLRIFYENVEETCGGSSTIVLALIELVRLCTSPKCLKEVSRADQPYSITVFGAARLLGVLGQVLTPKTSQVVLQNLTESFHRLLSIKFWPMQLFAMTALVRFASSIPSRYKNLLPNCVPSSMQKLLQCRLQCSVLGGSCDNKPRRWLHWQVAQELYKLTVPPDKLENKRVFPSSSSFSVSVGSYFISMPTQAGRKAVVIFPPDEESLKDIHCMLAGGDFNEKPHVQTVRHTCTMPNGECKLFLQ